MFAQSQGAITERLRSFSMHDLTAIQGDEAVGGRSFPPLQEAQKKSKTMSSETPGKSDYFLYYVWYVPSVSWAERTTGQLAKCFTAIILCGHSLS